MPAAAVPAGPAAAAAASQQQQQLLLQQLGSSGVEAAAGLVDALHALHEERLLGLLAHLHAAAHAAGSDAFALETLRSAASRPESLEAFDKGCEQAADALIGIGALPQSVGLAEAFHDYKTLGTLCTRQLPSLPPALLRGRHVSSPAELRHELIARLIAAPPPPPLYPHESRAKPSFVHELCLAHYEAGPAGCRELLRLPESYPFLAEPLKEFLSGYPRLLWMHLVDEAAGADESAADQNPEAPPTSLHDAARALYGWGLQTGQGVSAVERRTFLSLGKLCHRAAVLRGPAADAVASHAAACHEAAQAGLPPPLPPRAPPPEALAKVVGVPVAMDGGRREESKDISLADVSNEQYVLRLMPELGLGGEAMPADALLGRLLSHATSDGKGGALEGARLPDGRPLRRDDALHLALDVAHKTAWRYAPSAPGGGAAEAGAAARAAGQACDVLPDPTDGSHVRARKVAASGASPAGAQRHPADAPSLRRRRRRRVGGGQRTSAEAAAAEAAAAGKLPLALFSLLYYQAAKAAHAAASAAAAASAGTVSFGALGGGMAASDEDDAWLGSDAIGENSMLHDLLSPLEGVSEEEKRRLASLMQRVQAICREQLPPPQQAEQRTGGEAAAAAEGGGRGGGGGGGARADEDWEDLGGAAGVDVMQD